MVNHNIIVKNKVILESFEKFKSLDSVSNVRDHPRDYGLWNEKSYQEICDYSTSDSTLEDIISGKISNWRTYRYSMIFENTAGGRSIISAIDSLEQSDICYTSGYHPKGFVSWHTDSAQAGVEAHWLMLSYSENGNGYFKYRDSIDKKIYQIDDKPGWFLKYGSHYGNNDTDMWHCAVSECTRFTWIFAYKDFSKFQSLLSKL